jgi:hypothetical protein
MNRNRHKSGQIVSHGCSHDRPPRRPGKFSVISGPECRNASRFSWACFQLHLQQRRRMLHRTRVAMADRSTGSNSRYPPKRSTSGFNRGWKPSQSVITVADSASCVGKIVSTSGATYTNPQACSWEIPTSLRRRRSTTVCPGTPRVTQLPLTWHRDVTSQMRHPRKAMLR